jgi:glucose/arabinose dehydrogenase/phosphodiesterase/alkaline phosphatase D-like protein
MMMSDCVRSPEMRMPPKRDRRNAARWFVATAIVAVVATLTPVTKPAALRAQGDTQPPAVVSRSPSPSATTVSTQIIVRAIFSEAIQPATLSFVLRNSGGTIIPATATYDSDTLTASLDPSSDLAASATFTATISGVKDLAGNSITAPVVWSFTTATPTFQQATAFSGLVQPTAVEFASDGRVFVAEKSGLIKVFSSLTATSPTIFADLRTKVYNYWDRGLLSLVLHPQFPSVPYVYVLYSHDAPIGGTAPYWGTAGATSDPCPDPPGGTTEGCVVSARLSRLQASGSVMESEDVLIEDWFQQFPSHSIGTVLFGPDGALYVSGGDGASFHFVDYGQRGIPLNPGGDPPVPVGGTQTPPTAEGGALRSQDLRSAGDPVTLDGTIIRIDPDTAAAPADNPLFFDPDPNAKRIIAYGLRNPFRFTVRPGTREIWIGDVGWNTWEEINRIVDATDATVENFGWPCFEGTARQSGYDGANLNLCEQLYNEGAAAIEAPFFTYRHDQPLTPTDSCGTGSSAISGIAFYDGTGNYPSNYNNALFLADYSRSCIWMMFADAQGVPDPATRAPFIQLAGTPAQLRIGPGGDLYYVDHTGGRIRRIRYFPGNQPPIANVQASPVTGSAPLLVSFSAAASTDPENGQLSYAWDLDDDGQFDDSTAAQPTWTYGTGAHIVRVRVTDNQALFDTAAITILADEERPRATINTPSSTLTWKVGDVITFSGSATDAQDGQLSAANLSWSVTMQHCPDTCHPHPVQSFNGVASGSFSAPDHEYPSHLELTFTATDSSGLQDTVTLELYPQTVTLGFATVPSGLQVVVGPSSGTAPFTRTVIVGSSNSVSAPSPQGQFQFLSWSDGGAQSHNIVAGASPVTYTATFNDPTPPLISGVQALQVSTTGATIQWTTNEPADRQVEYGTTTAYGTLSGLNTNLSSTHSVGLAGLAASTLYHYRVRSRDAAGNLALSGDFTFTTPAPGTCPCSLWPLSTVPDVPSHTDTAAVELGVRFSADNNGVISGIRFYKGPANTGVHVGNLWTTAGVRLATATFSNETAQGWQTVTFPTPVAVTAGTTYVASYFAPSGGYARTANYFTAPYDNAPLHAPASGNGLYLYGTTSGFPTKTYAATNYWVDVVFIPGNDETPPVISGVQASQVTAAGATIQWSTNEPADRQVEYGTTTAYGTLSALNTTLSSTHSVALAGLSANTLYHYRVRSRDAAGNLAVSGDRTVTTAAADATPPVISGVQASQVSTTGATIQWSTNEPADRQVEYGTTTAYGTFSPLHTSLSSTHSVGLAGLSANMLYHYRVRSRDAAGNLALSGDFTFTTPAPGTCPCSLWPLSTVPAVASHADTAAVELGVRFSADTAGSITGIRFYKGPANTGVHVGNLWTTAGVRLATATFSNETAQGWQTVTFPTPVVVTAGTTYVASYFAPNGGYARTESYFTTPHDNAPLHAPATGNGVYRYGTAGGFPTKTYAATNYWVDVIFTQGSAPDTTPPGRSDGQPAGTLPAGTTQTTLSLTTSESATCRYAPTAGVSYAAMATTFGTTGGTSHATSVSGLASGTSYTYYVRCQDDAGNANPDDFTIAFAVATADTTPPVRSNGHPTGTLPAGTTQTTLSLTTSEAATCRYAPTAGVSYAAMATTFGTTGGTSHATSVSGLESGTTYTYYVRCQDGAGNGNPDDFTIAFAVATPDTTPPAVTMTEPANAAMTSGNISISATASDDIGVVGVQFLLNGSPIGEEDVDAPYSIQWNSRSVPDGSYELSARARDAAGNQTTASPITITVTNR